LSQREIGNVPAGSYQPDRNAQEALGKTWRRYARSLFG